ncbi:response regulator [Candidatus Beckwithbacteria bacterium]|nr:response regulator [Candidatus Beckwithbacteria bacterium]
MAKKILLVEDDSLLINMYKTKFESEGFIVLTAGDGEAGLQIIQNQIPDFIVLDYMMPKMSGFEFLQTIKQNQSLKHIPVIMLSNMSNPTEAQKAKQLGVNEFLVKANFTPSQITEKVKQYLK